MYCLIENVHIMKNWLSYSVACAALMLSACGAEDYFNTENGEAYREKYTQDVKNEFRTNFEEKFGVISPSQTWDFAGNNPYLTRAVEYSATAVEGLNFGLNPQSEYVKKGYTGLLNKWVIKDGTNNITSSSPNYGIYNDISVKQLPDSKQHTGKTAYLVAPSNDFTIYPVSAQGGYTYDLYVKVGENPEVKVFSKNFSASDKPYVNGMAYSINEKNGEVSKSTMPGIHINAEVGTEIQIYLKNIKNGNTSVNKNVLVGLGTSNGIYVEPSDPNIKPDIEGMLPNAEIRYIGIEDQYDATTKKPAGDLDFNDLVLCIVGNPFVPKEIIIENGESTVSTSVSKRYMIEDLGTTDDFDYNDVVVDVVKTTSVHHKITYVNGEKTEDVITGTDVDTKAIIRALGGTLDFNLTIGNTTWSKRAVTNNPYAMWNTGTPTSAKDEKGFVVYDGTNINWNAEEYVITGIEGWNPEDNNISIEVFQNRMSDAASTGINAWSMRTEFPAPGATPFIIAVPVTQKWSVERKEFDFKNYLK